MKRSTILITVCFVAVIVAVVVPIAVILSRSDEAEDAPLVNTTVGFIRGVRSDDGSAMFLGIPYARVDGSNPFGAADLNVTFEQPFDAFNDSARCPQVFNMNDTTLDCLHLNIHVPENAGKEPLPVFVYIHGGGFFNRSAGRNNIGPKFLIRHDVIFVSINYRLSVYGFLCLNTPEVPGNQGLKDQLNALRWIKKNIKAFGGDDENITITGDSAGGISVHLLLLFAEAGLFNKVVTQSGTAFSPWIFHDPDVNAAVTIANHLGFETNETNTAISFLANQTSNQLMLAVANLGLGFGPCVEEEFPNVERLISSHPVNTTSYRASNVTLLTGYNDDEWVILYANIPDELFKSLDIFNRNLNFGFVFGEKHEAMKSFVRRFYAADEPITAKLRRAVVDFDSDFVVNHPTQRTLRHHLDNGGLAYHYVFSYVGGRNNNNVGGAAHSDELRYLYDMPDLTETPTPADQLIIDRITTLWTNFAKYGNPTPTNTTLLPVQWQPATWNQLNYLDINTNMALRTRPFHKRLSFWDFFYHNNRKYVRGFPNETLVTK